MASAVIAIPCLNEANYIGDLLLRLLEDTHVHGTQIVVADGGSSDGTADIVEQISRTEPRVSLVHNPQKLQSAAVNQVARLFVGQAEYLIRIDAHASYPAGFAGRLIETAVEMGAQSVVVPMIAKGQTCFQKAAAAAQNSKLGTGGSSHRHAGKSGWIDHGHHALFNMTWYLRLGGYNEAFSHNEDAEYDYRLAQSGGRAWLAGDLPITYYPRRTPGTLLRQYFNFGKGRARTVRLHKMPLKFRQALPISIVPICLAALLIPLHPVFALPVLFWSAACIGFGMKLGYDKRSWCAAASGLAAMLMHLGWSAGFWAMVLTRQAKLHNEKPHQEKTPLGIA